MKEQLKQKLFVICGIGAIICVLLLGITKFLEVKDENLQQELLEKVTVSGTGDTESTEEGSTEEILMEIDQLYEENQDFVGWISIADTQVNYPVMHTPEDGEYYLRKDFNGNYSIAGTIFASYDSSFSPRSDNIILYGHNMSNGSMFADLLNYAEEDYWLSHKTIQFDTLEEEETYEVVYAFTQDIGMDNLHFDFYNFITAEDEEEFNSFIENCKTYSDYDTENTPVYGDKLLTLVTCKDYDTTERMVVVAKAVETSSSWWG